MNLLIADDSDAFKASLKKLLSVNSGIKYIDDASTIADSIKKIRINTPDMLILDLMFPEGSGLEVLEEARKHSEIETIIILTNFPYEKLKVKCFEYGAHFFFDKSNEFDKVIDVVNKFIKISGETND